MGETRLANRSAGDSDTLALALRKGYAALAENRVITLWQSGNKIVRVSQARRRFLWLPSGM